MRRRTWPAPREDASDWHHSGIGHSVSKYGAIGRMLAFLLAASGLNACVDTTTPPQGMPQALLAAVTKSDVRDYWTNDFGRAKRTGG